MAGNGPTLGRTRRWSQPGPVARGHVSPSRAVQPQLLGIKVKTISSAQTFLMKVIFPVAWITGFGAGTLSLWLGSMHGIEGAPSPQEKWQFMATWIAGTAFILWGCAGLKRVRLDATHLYVSNFRKEISVPLGNLVSVTENRWINIHPVTVHFRVPTEFGQTITFMPAARLFGFWSSDPVVAELKKLAGIAS